MVGRRWLRSRGRGASEGEPPRLAMDLPAAAASCSGPPTRARCRAAVPGLLRALEDVRARPYVADALGRSATTGRARRSCAFLATEPYVTTRPHEARALLALRRAATGPSADPPRERARVA